MKTCPQCAKSYPDSEMFCADDGTALSGAVQSKARITEFVKPSELEAPSGIECPVCGGKALSPEEEICAFCGAKLSASRGAAAAPSSGRPAPAPRSPEPPRQQTFDDEPMTPPTERPAGRRFLGAIGYTLAAIAALAAGVWFALHLSAKHAEQANIAPETPAAVGPVVAMAINPPPQGLWAGSVTVGANLQSGNTDRASASVAAGAERRTDRDRFSLGFLYNYGKENDQLTVRNTYASGKYDYFFTKKLYGYLALELLNDQFQDIDLRTTVGPGIGYQIWDDPIKSLAFEGGVSYVSENLRVGEDNDYFAARLGLNLRYNLFKSVVFTNRLLYFPSLEQFSTYTLRNEAAVTTPLGAQWALKLANIYQYNSEPSPGLGNTDSQWILGLQYSY